MAIIDEVRVKQIFDPTGENGGYKFEVLNDHPWPDAIQDIADDLGDQKCNAPNVVTPNWKPVDINIKIDAFKKSADALKGLGEKVSDALKNHRAKSYRGPQRTCPPVQEPVFMVEPRIRLGDAVKLQVECTRKGERIPNFCRDIQMDDFQIDKFLPGFADQMLGIQEGIVNHFDLFIRPDNPTDMAGKWVNFGVGVVSIGRPSEERKPPNGQTIAEYCAELKSALAVFKPANPEEPPVELRTESVVAKLDAPGGFEQELTAVDAKIVAESVLCANPILLDMPWIEVVPSKPEDDLLKESAMSDRTKKMLDLKFPWEGVEGETLEASGFADPESNGPYRCYDGAGWFKTNTGRL